MITVMIGALVLGVMIVVVLALSEKVDENSAKIKKIIKERQLKVSAEIRNEVRENLLVKSVCCMEKDKTPEEVENSCAECGCEDVSKSMEDYTFPYGNPVSVDLTVEVPVYKCEGCGYQWMNYEAGDIMDAYVEEWKKENILEAGNIYMEPIEIKHADLERVNGNSMFRSVCPVCKEGTLLVGRDQKTFKLIAEDNCILCGQHFVYTDIDELRKKVGEIE